MEPQAWPCCNKVPNIVPPATRSTLQWKVSERQIKLPIRVGDLAGRPAEQARGLRGRRCREARGEQLR